MPYRKNFQFNGMWRGRKYQIKQVAPIVADEDDRLVVVTVFLLLRDMDEKCRHQDTKSQRPTNLKCFSLCLRVFVAKEGVFGRASRRRAYEDKL